MAKGTPRLSRWTVAGIYTFLTFLFLWPLVDLGTTIWPLAPGRLEWRYGFLGILTAYWHTPVLASLLAMLVAFFLGHRKIFFGLSYFYILWAVGLVVILILFPLDVIQVRATTPAANQKVMVIGAIISMAKHFSAFAIVLLLGWGGLKTGKTLPRAGRGPDSSERTAEIMKAQQRD